MIGFGLAGRAGAAENIGVTAEPALQIPEGSRALAMGGAFTAVADDGEALYYNPAGLSLLRSQEVSATYIQGLSDNNLQQFEYAAPVTLPGFTDHGFTSVAASLLYSQAGTIQENLTNSNGSFLSSQNLNAGTDLIGSLAYSERLWTSGSQLPGEGPTFDHYFGVSGKYIRSTLAQQYSAQAASVDAGYLVDSPDLGLRLGVSALNIVGSMKYVAASDPLPATLRAGASWNRDLGGGYSLTLAGDGQYLYYEREPLADLGLELWLYKTVALRAGYQFLQSSLGLTAGVGVTIRRDFTLDYAWALETSANLGDSQRVSLTFRFGPVDMKRRGSGYRELDLAPEEAPTKNLNEQQIRLNNVPQATPAPSQTSPEQKGVPGWIY